MKRALPAALLLSIAVGCSSTHAGLPCREGEVSGLTGCTPKGETRLQKYSWEPIKLTWQENDVKGCDKVGSESYDTSGIVEPNYRKAVEETGGDTGHLILIASKGRSTTLLFVYKCANEAPSANAEQELEAIRKTGVLMKLDGEAKAAYVEPAVWNKLPFDEKKALASTLRGVIGSRWVSINDGYSGKPLATFSKTHGYQPAAD